MKSLNRVMLIGHLASDPDVRQTKNGNMVCTFSLATNYKTKSQDGEVNETTDFHKIVSWNGLADVCNKILLKGTLVYLDGRLVNSSYENAEGVRRYKTEIVMENMNVLKYKERKEAIPVENKIEASISA